VARKHVLLIGGEKSGKSAWATATAHKCAAPRVVLGPKTYHRRDRNKIFDALLQFAREDRYVLIDL